MQIKNEMKGFLPESKVISKWKEISDTNLETFQLGAFRNRIFGTVGCASSPTAVKFVKSGIVSADGFPPTVQCLELILECAKHYNPERRAILTSNGKLLANLTTGAIGETFGILAFHSMTYKTKDRAATIYEAGVERCAEIIVCCLLFFFLKTLSLVHHLLGSKFIFHVPLLFPQKIIRIVRIR